MQVRTVKHLYALMAMRQSAEEMGAQDKVPMEEIFKFTLHRNNNNEPSPVAAQFLDLLYSDPHPARTIDYDRLISGLEQAVEKKTVLAKKDKSGKLTIYNYVAPSWGFFECLARGVVIDEENRKIVATPFPKFFNYGEMSKSFPTGPFQAAEKMDGSLGVAFWYEDNWHVSTRGAFQSTQAEWATQWFRSNVAPKLLFFETHQDSTILVEIIYPENRIVIGYDFSALVLLGAYHGNGLEYSRAELEDLAATVDMRLVALHQFESVEDVLQSAISLPADKEGWVLRFPSSGYRMKIKGDQYCDLHRSISLCTPLTIWGMMKDNEDIKTYGESLPEEFAADLLKIVQTLQDRLEDCLETLKVCIEATNHLSSKELGMLSPKAKKRDKNVETILVPSATVEEDPVAVPTWTMTYLFQSKQYEFQDGTMLDLIRDPQGNAYAQRLRERIFQRFRPANNSLDGYSPAGVTNRFADDTSEG